MMTISRISFLAVLTFFISYAEAQQDSTKVKETVTKTDSLTADSTGHTNLEAYLYELEQISGKDNIKHTDSVAGYSLVIPNWWRIRETPNNMLFGGTFPAIEDVENALLFKAFDKSKFDDIDTFERWVIADYRLGDKPKWSRSHSIVLKRELENFEDLGKSYKVQLMWGSSIYHCCYIIIETSTSFLWIDFTATQDTYDVNFPKLESIMANFKTL